MFIETQQGDIRITDHEDGILMTVTDNPSEEQAKALLSYKCAKRLADEIYRLLKENNDKAKNTKADLYEVS